MAPIPFARLFGIAGRRAVESVAPRRTFDDVILPPATKRALDIALSQVTQHDLIFNRWGFAERHPTGLALAFNFAGPSGTGKTICAEAIAHSLGRRLLLIRYAELESLWMGETPKNVVAIFKAAREEGAVLLFDEADALFGKRSEVRDSHDRYANIEISFLLQQMEQYEGIAILATNLRQNMDDAFIRRLQFAVEFPFPDAEDRRRIWEVLFPDGAPRDPGIDFAALAREYRMAGGNIKNAVLAAAFIAAAEGVPIGTDHVVRATRRELQKMGRVVGVADPEADRSDRR